MGLRSPGFFFGMAITSPVAITFLISSLNLMLATAFTVHVSRSSRVVRSGVSLKPRMSLKCSHRTPLVPDGVLPFFCFIMQCRVVEELICTSGAFSIISFGNEDVEGFVGNSSLSLLRVSGSKGTFSFERLRTFLALLMFPFFVQLREACSLFVVLRLPSSRAMYLFLKVPRVNVFQLLFSMQSKDLVCVQNLSLFGVKIQKRKRCTLLKLVVSSGVPTFDCRSCNSWMKFRLTLCRRCLGILCFVGQKSQSIPSWSHDSDIRGVRSVSSGVCVLRLLGLRGLPGLRGSLGRGLGSCAWLRLSWVRTCSNLI